MSENYESKNNCNNIKKNCNNTKNNCNNTKNNCNNTKNNCDKIISDYYEKNYYSKPQNTFKDLNLESNKIDTLTISGGAYGVFLFVGMIKYLIEIDELKNINKIYAVSAGNLIALIILLKFNLNEIREIVMYPPMKKILDFESKDILNLFDKLGITEGDNNNNLIKYIFEKKNINPFITFEDLYKISGVDYNVGVTSLFKMKFLNINHINYPKMPIWIAIRASCGVPFLFTPIHYYEINDFLIDGAILNNNPIGIFLEDYYKSKKKKLNENIKKETQNTKSLQSFKDFIKDKQNNNSSLIYESAKKIQKLIILKLIKNKKKKYKRNFIALDFDYDNFHGNTFDIKNINFVKFLSQLFKCILFNQEANRNEYKQYVLNIELYKCEYNYCVREHSFTDDNYDGILKYAYDYSKEYFEKYIKN